ncbi:hypothetical protein C2G38_2176941 [Gigaspora rosea]|uniref:Uncharacterized protein n=1 Tax=Gigaspora rosea TaxID=44941 RepID=A0A397VFT0_9GLOM|nr:hypothetical protein C2G38_2176941 [Gigaspora rosea]
MKDLETIPSTKPKLSEFMEGAANVANNALSSIVPKLGIVISLINDIFTIHENAQFNKKILQYQETFARFQAILKKIKMFTAFETFSRAMNIKKEFIELMKEYEACMNDLSFTMIIVFNEQRRIDNDILTDILSKMIKV